MREKAKRKLETAEMTRPKMLQSSAETVSVTEILTTYTQDSSSYYSPNDLENPPFKT